MRLPPRRVVLASLAAAVVAERLAARLPGVAEAYARHPGTLLTRGLSRLSGAVPFSLAEALIVAGSAAALFGAARALSAVVRAPAGRRAPELGHQLAGGASAALALVLAFDLLWGVYYARPELAARLGWPPAHDEAGDEAELLRLTEQLVLATNGAYESLGGGRDQGRPTTAPDPPALERALEQAFVAAAADLPSEPGLALPRGRAKPVLLSGLLSRLGISGFYFPFTGEANYNRLPPGCARPHVIAHEKAHQRGAASEDEAEFVAFVACLRSADPYVRYAGLLFGQRELLFELMERDPRAASRLVARRDPGVQRDVDDLRAFWRAYEGGAATVSRAVNDTYLRAQGVKGGVDSYRRGARLIVRFARARGGSAVP